MNILDHIEIVPDFPIKGINFYDIQSLLKKPDIWSKIIDQLAEQAREQNANIILGIESRGFLSGVPVAQKLGLPFGMIRKKGKLPGDVLSQDYALEYGHDTIQVQRGLISGHTRASIMDDLMATGGTLKAAGDLVRQGGGSVVHSSCIIELHELGGRSKLDFPFESLFKAPLDPFSQKNEPETFGL